LVGFFLFRSEEKAKEKVKMSNVHTLSEFQPEIVPFSTENPRPHARWGRNLNENSEMITGNVLSSEQSSMNVLDRPDVVRDDELERTASEMLEQANSLNAQLYVSEQDVQRAEERGEFMSFDFSKAKQKKDLATQIRHTTIDAMIEVDALKQQRNHYRRQVLDIENKIQKILRKAQLKKKILQRRMNSVGVGGLDAKTGPDDE
jgi:hypothetical protein